MHMPSVYQLFCLLGLLAVLLTAAWLISVQLNRKLFLAFEVACQAYNHVYLIFASDIYSVDAHLVFCKLGTAGSCRCFQARALQILNICVYGLQLLSTVSKLRILFCSVSKHSDCSCFCYS